MALNDFLKTARTKEDLKLCLDIINEFKNCETKEEWLFQSFESWQKLELLVTYLEGLTNPSPPPQIPSLFSKP